MDKQAYFSRIIFGLTLYSLILIACLFAFRKTDYKYNLSVVAIFQNEDRFLKEWIDYHRLQGVDHFYLFNNLSSDHYQQVLQPYIDANIVELYDWPYASAVGNESDFNQIQTRAYREALKLANGISKWVAIIDTDEFIFPKNKTIKEFLIDYEDCSGILINWQVFGTSLIPKVPNDKLMIETLVHQAPVQAEMNTYCKSIVRPEKVKYCIDPHSPIYYPWGFSVDPDKYTFRWKFHKQHPVKIDKICINHYWSRDEAFFNERKIARYERWGAKQQACLHRNAEANQVYNTDIHVLVPALQQLQKQDQISNYTSKEYICEKLDTLL